MYCKLARAVTASCGLPYGNQRLVVWGIDLISNVSHIAPKNDTL